MLHLRPSSSGAASDRRTSVLPFLDGNEDVRPDTTIGSAGPNIAHSSIAASHDVSQALEAAVRYRPLRGGDLARKIRRRLSEQHGSYPSVQAMAQALNMSPRTLLRKLKQEGTTYQRLLDKARKDVAKWYLLRTRMPIDVIADRLGYVDASNFSRGFRRWFGRPPGKFRKDRRKTKGIS